MKGLLLLSGGIDSPVAAHMMQKHGMELIALHFSLEPMSNDETVEKCRVLCKKLGIHKMYYIKHGQQQAEIVNRCENRLFYVITRRNMVKIANKIAAKEGCDVIVTGENLGQVGSQTLSNMEVTDAASTLPVLRPLLCMDKVEIIAIAKEIGTYEDSLGPEVCCLLGPKHPATRSTMDKVEHEEMRLPEAFVDDAVQSADIEIY